VSAHCSICRHPLRDSINVSLLRDGTRFTARQFQVSRPALDRHKRHVRTSVPIKARAGNQTADVVARPDDIHSPLSELNVLMRRCEQALMQETGSGDFCHVLRVAKELGSCLELRVKLEAQKSRDVPSVPTYQPRRAQGDAECNIRILQRVCFLTRGFHPLKLWQLKALHDQVMSLIPSKSPADEIVRQITLRTSYGSGLSLLERLFGGVRKEEWQGREQEVAQAIVRDIREGLKGYLDLLQRVDNAFAASLGKRPPPQQDTVAHHLEGKLSGTACLNLPYCGPE
jgi:uncharacterized membrane protein YccC